MNYQLLDLWFFLKLTIINYLDLRFHLGYIYYDLR